MLLFILLCKISLGFYIVVTGKLFDIYQEHEPTDMDELAQQLEQAEVLGKLPEPVRVELAKLAIRREIPRGEYLCHQGYVWQNALFVASGRMRWTMLSAGGQEHTLFVLEPPSVFWAHSMFDDEPMPASLAAIKDSVAVRLAP